MASVFLPIQRGFENLIANWPLLLIRVAETVVIVIVTVASVVVALLVAGVVTTIGAFENAFDHPDRLAEWIVENPLLLALLFVAILVAALVGLLVHSVFVGGVIGCLIEGERAAPHGAAREELRVFSPDRWFVWTRRTWWPVFLIYNVTWGAFGIILIVPSLALLALVIATGENTGTIVVACGGSILLLLFAFIGGVFVTVWSRAALVISVGGDQDVAGPVRQGFRVCFERLGELVVLYVAMLAVSFGVGSASFSLSFGLDMASSAESLAMFALLVQILISIIQSLVSIFMSTWAIAGTVTIVNDWQTGGL